MKVAPSADQMNSSLPLGCEPPRLFILRPNGNAVSRLIPRYRLVNAPAGPEHETLAPPACFSAPPAGAVQFHPPTGPYTGPPVMTIAFAGVASPSSATTASVSRLAATEPR